MKDSEVFRRARSVLRERGRAVGHWRDAETGAVCVNAACSIARNAVPGLRDEPALQEAMRSLGIEGYVFAMTFNDDARTTDDDIFELLERAEKCAEQREEQEVKP